MKDVKSTAQMKLESVQRLKSWFEDKCSSGTIGEYIRNGKLNRSEIALECGFSRSSFSSNDLLLKELQLLEVTLKESGILSKSSDIADTKSGLSALENKLAGKERQINSLRERLTVKTAENEVLKKKLASSNLILDDIIPTGRRVRL